MRFTRLDLRCVGPFAEVVLDLSAGDRGLHLIHGPNEAGKSSALRAVCDMLFGFPHQSKAAHGGDNDKLRVGATIRGEGGTELSFLRLKKLKKSLVEPEGRVALDDLALSGYLGGITASAFNSLFALDHVRLRAGGDQILSDGGDLGPLVFASGVDLRRLAEIRKDVESRHAELFNSRGQNQKINKALAELAEARERVLEGSLPWDSFHDKSRERDARSQELGDLEARIVASKAALERLKRLRRALPDLGLRRDFTAELCKLATVPALADDFTARRVSAEQGSTTARALGDRATSELMEVDQLRAGIAAPGLILEEAETIERLYRAAKQHADDRTAVEGRRREADALSAELSADRDHLNLSSEADPRPSKLVLDRLRTLHQALPELNAECVGLSKSIDQMTAEIDAIDGPLPDLSTLVAAIEAGQRAAGDFALHKKAAIDRAKVARRAEAALREMTPALPGGLAVGSMACPQVETIKDHELAIQEADGKVERMAAEVLKLRLRLRDIVADLEAQRRERAIPSEADLVNSRVHRDEVWGRLKAMIEHDPRRAFSDRLPAELEAATGRSDSLADSLRAESQRVNQRLAWEAERDRLEVELGDQQADLTAAEHAAETARDDWITLWSATGIVPASPRDMLIWSESRRRYLELVEQREDLDEELRGWSTVIDRAARQLDAALAELGQPIEPAGIGLDGRLVHAIKVEKRLGEQVERRTRLDDDLAGARRDERDALRRLKLWRAEWSHALLPLGLGPGSETCKPGELIGWVERWIAGRERIEGAATLEARYTAYKREVAELCGRVHPAFAERAADDAIGKLNRQLKDAFQARTALEGLDGRASASRAASISAACSRREHDRVLDELRVEAGCEYAQQVPEVEALAARRRSLQIALQAAEDRLRDHAAGGTIEALEVDASTVDRDALGPQIDGLEASSIELYARQTELARQVGGLDAELRRMTEVSGRSAAVDAQERVEEIRGSMERDIQKYVEARLAAEVLDRAIQAYLEKNRGPILGRAGELFARLTGGRFGGIEVEYGGDEQALVGVRPAGREHLGVDAMSQGTADQLYLALKLAGLEHYLDHHPPMPVLLDDILIHFDDERSTAALEVLADLSRRTQVLLFTHHEHLVALAREAVGPDTLFVHRLCAGTPAAV